MKLHLLIFAILILSSCDPGITDENNPEEVPD